MEIVKIGESKKRSENMRLRGEERGARKCTSRRMRKNSGNNKD